MTRDKVRGAIDRAGFRVLGSDADGIWLRRSGIVSTESFSNAGRWRRSWQGTYHEEEWRVYCGGGIAGHGGEWWLAPRSRLHGEPIGPFATQKALVSALRTWRRWELP